MAHLAPARRRSSRRPVDPGLTSPEPAHRRRRHSHAGPAVLIAVVSIVAWEACARAGVISPVFFPPPTRILATLWRDTASGTLLTDIRATLLRTIPALALGGAPGLMLGLAMGWSWRLRNVAEPFVAAFHPIPKLALLPLFIVVLGIGEAPKVLVIAVAAFFPMLINAMAGVRQISPVHFDVAANYGASPVRVLYRVVLPGSLPFVLAGLRLAANIALVTAIAVEMIAAGTGLGARVWLSWQVLRTEQLYATLAVIAIAGIGLNALLVRLEAWLVPWQPRPGSRA